MSPSLVVGNSGVTLSIQPIRLASADLCGNTQEPLYHQHQIEKAGFSFLGLFVGEDIIPQFLFLAMQDCPRHDLKKRVMLSFSGFYLVSEQERIEELNQGLASIVLDLAVVCSVDRSISGFVLEFAMQEIFSWFLPLDPYPELYLLLGITNLDVQDSFISRATCWGAGKHFIAEIDNRQSAISVSQVFEYSLQVIQMIIKCPGKYVNTIQIYRNAGQLEVTKNQIHGLLERDWGVT
ncbi:hypothetical protein DSO57_1037848 [Entomophthora muscae]|uniref:Uncharacterized protein n=1 Tax=Entomophthora muscae TaxID=34485 RepID=A0ACC2SNS7_9FUNG|nr:hypothetical protein DSO57_1037848 [Entomophthora muscae]